jgi:hypothetical protein
MAMYSHGRKVEEKESKLTSASLSLFLFTFIYLFLDRISICIQLAWNLNCSCVHLLSAGITGATNPFYSGINPFIRA